MKNEPAIASALLAWAAQFRTWELLGLFEAWTLEDSLFDGISNDPDKDPGAYIADAKQILVDHDLITNGNIIREPSNEEEFHYIARAIAILDSYFEPHNGSYSHTNGMSNNYYDSINNYYTINHNFASVENVGIIISAYCLDGERSIETEKLPDITCEITKNCISSHSYIGASRSKLSLILSNTVFLPYKLDYKYSNFEGKEENRTIKINYQRVDLGQYHNSSVSVAIAPIGQTKNDHSVCFDSVDQIDGSKKNYYHISASNEQKTRINDVVKKLNFENNYILVCPEAIVCNAQISDFINQINQLDNPPLFSIIGYGGHLGEKRTHPCYQNKAKIVFKSDIYDEFDQHKLIRWDFNSNQINRFGFDTVAPCYEDICSADEYYIIDVKGFGRIAVLICADAYQNTPGDWLFVNAKIDWLFILLFDQSLCSWLHPEQYFGPWAIERAARAAYYGRSKVIAVNSMVLTDIINNKNKDSNHEWTWDKAGIGYFVSAEPGRNSIIHKSITVDIIEEAIVEKVTWPNCDEDEWESLALLPRKQ